MTSSTYFFNNETKNDCVYVKNTGSYTMDIQALVIKICDMKKWDKNDKVIILLMDTQNMIRYIYHNERFDICFKENSKYDVIEIETDEKEVDDCDCGCCSDYDDEYDEYEDYEDYDDRYDEREDYGYDGGYEDEFYECCDIY